MMTESNKAQGHKALIDWWQACRPKGEIPAWSDLTAAPEPSLMPNLAMHDVHPSHKLVVRYFGSDLVELWGKDYTGQDIAVEFKSSKAYQKALRVIQRCATMPCGGVTVGMWTTDKGTSYLRRQTYLPIKPSLDGVPRIISHADHESHVIDMPEQIGLSRMKHIDWIDVGFGVPRKGLVGWFSWMLGR